MSRTALVGALVVICWSGICGARQSGTVVPLPEPLRSHVTNEQFGIVTSIRGLPLGVREALQGLFGTPTLDIAEPGAPFRETNAAGGDNLPTRRLLVAGCSEDHCLVYYERGGTAHTWHAALFHWTPAQTRLEAGGLAARDMKSVADVRAALLSGAFKDANKVW